MTDHDLEGFTLAVLLLALVLAAGSSLRWDLLKLWWQDLFILPLEGPPRLQPIPLKPNPHAPRRLHDSELQHQTLHHRPSYHRSGRRS